MKSKSDFYSNKKYKTNLDSYKTGDSLLDSKIDEMQNDLSKGFTLYNRRNFDRFMQGHAEISDFAEQFVLLDEYYSCHNKYSNSEKLYQILYGETLGSDRWQEKIDKVKGSNNPWYDHGGKLSPFSKKSKSYSKESIEKAAKNRSYNTTLEYYLSKGYSEKEAVKLLKERQATGRLDNYQKRYGDELGLKKWEECQIKWQSTMRSKSPEEIERINKSKSSGTGNMSSGKCYLYYMRFFNDERQFYKVGITTRGVYERFNLHSLNERCGLNFEIIHIQENNTDDEAFEIEQSILNKYSKERIRVDYRGFKSTECFESNVLEWIL